MENRHKSRPGGSQAPPQQQQQPPHPQQQPPPPQQGIPQRFNPYGPRPPMQRHSATMVPALSHNQVAQMELFQTEPDMNPHLSAPPPPCTSVSIGGVQPQQSIGINPSNQYLPEGQLASRSYTPHRPFFPNVRNHLGVSTAFYMGPIPQNSMPVISPAAVPPPVAVPHQPAGTGHLQQIMSQVHYSPSDCISNTAMFHTGLAQPQHISRGRDISEKKRPNALEIVDPSTMTVIDPLAKTVKEKPQAPEVSEKKQPSQPQHPPETVEQKPPVPSSLTSTVGTTVTTITTSTCSPVSVVASTVAATVVSATSTTSIIQNSIHSDTKDILLTSSKSRASDNISEEKKAEISVDVVEEKEIKDDKIKKDLTSPVKNDEDSGVDIASRIDGVEPISPTPLPPSSDEFGSPQDISEDSKSKKVRKTSRTELSRQGDGESIGSEMDSHLDEKKDAFSTPKVRDNLTSTIPITTSKNVINLEPRIQMENSLDREEPKFKIVKDVETASPSFERIKTPMVTDPVQSDNSNKGSAVSAAKVKESEGSALVAKGSGISNTVAKESRGSTSPAKEATCSTSIEPSSSISVKKDVVAPSSVKEVASLTPAKKELTSLTLEGKDHANAAPIMKEPTVYTPLSRGLAPSTSTAEDSVRSSSTVKEPIISSRTDKGATTYTPLSRETSTLTPVTKESHMYSSSAVTSSTLEPLKSSEPDKIESDDTLNKESESSDRTTSPTPSVNGEDPPSKSSSQIKLKYTYKDDQWSPLNQSGKKQYDRTFLFMLQSDPLSQARPTNLPKMEIIKDGNQPNKFVVKGNTSSDFMPNFSDRISNPKSSSRNALPKRPSRDGRGSRGPPGLLGGPLGPNSRPGPITLSLPERRELKVSENAWRPSVARKTANPDPNTTEMDDLERKIRAILNKLTPQKFAVLIDKFNELVIDSETKLSLAMELIFEKALDEPNFCVAYAGMCSILQKKSVENSKFSTLLVTRCQKEFEKNYMSEEEVKLYKENLAAAKSEAEKKALKDEFDAKELKARRRSLGNIRFIGEIYKLGMLTLKIMHECVVKLLKKPDEESLECLCRLLTTVGKIVDEETGQVYSKRGNLNGVMVPFDSVFDQMRNIVKVGAVSSRVRFMLQDVIDLRSNKWVPRRDAAGPKTIDEIHRDIEKERKVQIVSNYNSTRSVDGTRMGNRNQSYQGGGSMNKRSFPRGAPASNGQSLNNSDEDRWRLVKNTRYENQSESIEKLKNFNLNKVVNADQVKLGPSLRPSWGRGSNSKAVKPTQPAADTCFKNNRFSSLSDDKDGPLADNRSSSLRSSRCSSVEADRGQSDFIPSDSKHRGVSPVKPVESSSSILGRNLKGASEMSEAAAEKISKGIFDEFCLKKEMEEVIIAIEEKFHKNTIKLFIDAVFYNESDAKPERRILCGELIVKLVNLNLLSISQLKESIVTFIEGAEDLAYEIPKLWDYFADMIIDAVPTSLPLSYLLQDMKESIRKLINSKEEQKFTLAVFRTLAKRKGKKEAADIFHERRLQLCSVVGCKPSELKEFISSNNFEFLVAPDAVKKKLKELLKRNQNSNEEIRDWIENNLGPHESKENWFIRVLVAECTRDAIRASDMELDEKILIDRFPLIKIHLNNVPAKELQALFAIIKLMVDLQFPPNLLLNLFNQLHDSEIIVSESFFAWRRDTSPAEQEGKGVAVSSTKQFFNLIHSSSTHDKRGPSVYS